MNLSKSTDRQWLAAAVTAASSTDDNSQIVDMANWEGVMFITAITDSAANGVASMIVEQNTVNSASGMAALGASGIAAATCAVNDDINGKLLTVDVYRPRERYLRVNRTSATANIAYGDVIAILYGPRSMPVTQTESADSDLAVSAAEA